LRYTFSSRDGVILDASPKHGSGSGDMYAYIPTSDGVGTGERGANSRDERALSHHRFFCGCICHATFTATSRGGWATCSFHKSTLQCLAEVTAIVASVFFAESNGVVLQTIPRHA
jgi:hypothetical protein